MARGRGFHNTHLRALPVLLSAGAYIQIILRERLTHRVRERKHSPLPKPVRTRAADAANLFDDFANALERRDRRCHSQHERHQPSHRLGHRLDVRTRLADFEEHLEWMTFLVFVHRYVRGARRRRLADGVAVTLVRAWANLWLPPGVALHQLAR